MESTLKLVQTISIYQQTIAAEEKLVLGTLWRQQSCDWKDVEGSAKRLKMAAGRFENIEVGETIHEYKRKKVNEKKDPGSTITATKTIC